MKLTITDIILIILIMSVLYLLFSSDKEQFTNDIDINNAVDKEINDRYTVDLSNMRNLNNLITNITNNTDELNITQNNVKIFDTIINDLNINNNLNVSDTVLFNSGASISGYLTAEVDNLKIKDTNVSNKININYGKFNDIYPKGSILLFYTGDKMYNIPYGWVPCDGSYYDVIQATADKDGKDENGYYVKFYKTSDNPPEKRNVDLAYEEITYQPSIYDLLDLRKIGFDKYFLITGVKNDPFSAGDLEFLNMWDSGNGLWQAIAIDPYHDRKTPKKKLTKDPIKRDYIYIRKII